MRKEDIIAKIRASIPDAQIELVDLTGTSDHWEATIISSEFEGKSLIQRHRLVFAALEEEMKGPIHALTIKTFSPAQAQQK